MCLVDKECVLASLGEEASDIHVWVKEVVKVADNHVAHLGVGKRELVGADGISCADLTQVVKVDDGLCHSREGKGGLGKLVVCRPLAELVGAAAEVTLGADLVLCTQYHPANYCTPLGHKVKALTRGLGGSGLGGEVKHLFHPLVTQRTQGRVKGRHSFACACGGGSI